MGHISILGPLGSGDKGGAGAGRLIADRAELTDLTHKEKMMYIGLGAVGWRDHWMGSHV
jgi:hypothetical protein